MSNTLLCDAAIDYASKGFPVIPILAWQKRPAVRGWYERATLDPAQISEWWELYPDSNVATVLGVRSGLCEIAWDMQLGEILHAALRTVAFPEGWDFWSPQGEHRLFRLPTEILSVTPLPPDVLDGSTDFRFGLRRPACVILPPSQTSPLEGQAWEWGAEETPQSIQDIPTLPAAWIKAILDENEFRPPEPTDTTPTH